jgi:hypothetical protein
MTTPTQALNTSRHNSTTNEAELLSNRNPHPNDCNNDNDTISIRTDSTTVPAANPPRRVTVSAFHHHLCLCINAALINGAVVHTSSVLTYVFMDI